MRIDIVTLFPELCDSFLSASILGRARAKNLFEAHCHQIRDYTKNKQKQTDDYPYGGGCGMVLYAQPIADCLRAVQAQCAGQGRQKPHVVFLTAAGRPYNEEKARELASYDAVTLVCGHYEGIDQRVIDAFGDEEISIGDYVLTGGELASLVVADSVLRLQPGVLAEEKGYQDESYWDGLLEYPQFTRPEVWEGRAVPPVLLTGDHKKIDEWRGAQSRERTRERRPDLYDAWCESHPLTELPKWKRGENMRLVKNDEQLALCAALMAEGRRTVCAPVRDEEYLEAAESISCSKFRIITRYVLPNSLSPVIVKATMSVAQTILTAASLSYVGLGVQPPTPEWGAMLSAGRAYIRSYPHLIMFPGIFIMITVLGLNLFGDGLRDALDPKLKK